MGEGLHTLPRLAGAGATEVTLIRDRNEPDAVDLERLPVMCPGGVESLQLTKHAALAAAFAARNNPRTASRVPRQAPRGDLE